MNTVIYLSIGYFRAIFSYHRFKPGSGLFSTLHSCFFRSITNGYLWTFKRYLIGDLIFCSHPAQNPLLINIYSYSLKCFHSPWLATGRNAFPGRSEGIHRAVVEIPLQTSDLLCFNVDDFPFPFPL